MTNVRSRNRTPWFSSTFPAFIAGFFALITASPSHAHHRDWSRQPRSGWTITIGNGDRPTVCDIERIEFRRGLQAAWRDGNARGYDDGRCGRAFCDEPNRGICSGSPAFIRGYEANYPAAYAEGHERGHRIWRCHGAQRIVLHRHSRAHGFR